MRASVNAPDRSLPENGKRRPGQGGVHPRHNGKGEREAHRARRTYVAGPQTSNARPSQVAQEKIT